MTGRGISTFELKECRQTKVKIVESASTHISLWVNSIVALSDSQFIVFDKDGNLFIFQKNLYPTCIEEKLKLTLKGSYCIGEEVQSAAFGSFRSTSVVSQSTDQLGEGVTDQESESGATGKDADSKLASNLQSTRQKKKQYITAGLGK